VAERLADDIGQFTGRIDRARGHNCPCDAPRFGLFAIDVDHIGDFGFVRHIDEIRSTFARLAHPHVERAVFLEGETAFGLVDLHRRDANVEHDGIDLLHAAFGKPLVYFRKAGGVEVQGTATPLCKVGTRCGGIGVAIKCMNARTRSQDSPAITASTKGAIHDV
jgi:hypothetical protein